MSKKLWTNTALRLLLGLMMSVVWVFIVEYFQATANQSSDLRPEQAAIEEPLDERAELKEARG